MTGNFDAYSAYYDAIYRDKDYAAEAEFVRGLMSRHGIEGGDLLELGCGTGRHAECFARMGFKVQGLDMSPGMIVSAKNRVPPDLAGRLSFQVADVRVVRVPRKFDAVLSLFHVLSYQTDNEDLLSVMKTAAVHLRPGGIFVFDIWYGPAVLTERPSVRVKRMEDGQVGIVRLAEPAMHANRNVVDVNYTVWVKDKHGRGVIDFAECHPMRYLFLPELEHMLGLQGFEVVNAVEWMTGNEPGYSTWSVAVCAILK